MTVFRRGLVARPSPGFATTTAAAHLEKKSRKEREGTGAEASGEQAHSAEAPAPGFCCRCADGSEVSAVHGCDRAGAGYMRRVSESRAPVAGRLAACVAEPDSTSVALHAAPPLPVPRGQLSSGGGNPEVEKFSSGSMASATSMLTSRTFARRKADCHSSLPSTAPASWCAPNCTRKKRRRLPPTFRAA